MTRQQRRAEAFSRMYVQVARLYDMPRKVRREMARDMAKEQMKKAG